MVPNERSGPLLHDRGLIFEIRPKIAFFRASESWSFLGNLAVKLFSSCCCCCSALKFRQFGWIHTVTYNYLHHLWAPLSALNFRHQHSSPSHQPICLCNAEKEQHTLNNEKAPKVKLSRNTWVSIHFGMWKDLDHHVWKSWFLNKYHRPAHGSFSGRIFPWDSRFGSLTSPSWEFKRTEVFA